MGQGKGLRPGGFAPRWPQPLCRLRQGFFDCLVHYQTSYGCAVLSLDADEVGSGGKVGEVDGDTAVAMALDYTFQEVTAGEVGDGQCQFVPFAWIPPLDADSCSAFGRIGGEQAAEVSRISVGNPDFVEGAKGDVCTFRDNIVSATRTHDEFIVGARAEIGGYKIVCVHG